MSSLTSTSPTASTVSTVSRLSTGRIPDPSTDMPTVWIPLSQEGAEATRASGRNTLALISLLASLVFPLAVLVNALGAVAQSNHLVSLDFTNVFAAIGAALAALGVPALMTALVTGHIALVIAKRFHAVGARRWMAIVGLILGYLSLLAIGSLMILFVLAGMHGF